MSAFDSTRDPEEQAKAFADDEFMAWLREYEPDYKTEFWNRNIVAMYHAYLAGKVSKGM